MALSLWTFSPASTPKDQIPIYAYFERHRTYSENFGSGNSTVTRTFMVNYEQRLQFLSDCLGYSTIDAVRPIPGIFRVLPDQLQELPGFYASEASVETVGQCDIYQGRSTWVNAEVKVVYRPVDYKILPDGTVSEWQRYVVKTFEPNAEFISLHGGMKFVNGQQVVSNPPNRISPAMQITYLWKDVPAKPSDPFTVPNLASLVACQGTVNNTSFDGYAAGTLLFLGAETRMVLPRLGLEGYHWDIAFKFLHKDNGAGIGGERAGCNYIFNLTTNAWDLPTGGVGAGTAGGNRIYGSSNFANLFTLDGA